MVEWILLTTMGDVNYIAFVVVVFSQVVSHVQGSVGFTYLLILWFIQHILLMVRLAAKLFD